MRAKKNPKRLDRENTCETLYSIEKKKTNHMQVPNLTDGNENNSVCVTFGDY